jgi:hypothetical protein
MHTKSAHICSVPITDTASSDIVLIRHIAHHQGRKQNYLVWGKDVTWPFHYISKHAPLSPSYVLVCSNINMIDTETPAIGGKTASKRPFDRILNFRDVGKTINEFLGEKCLRPFLRRVYSLPFSPYSLFFSSSHLNNCVLMGILKAVSHYTVTSSLLLEALLVPRVFSRHLYIPVPGYHVCIYLELILKLKLIVFKACC